ncbi:MAG: response regulator [Spirochaetia bacterium]|nr:response regulator [Spirochaetia bacterium]
MEPKIFTVLMAEDNEHDIIATKRAWKKYKINNPLFIVNDGEDCLDYLNRRGKYENAALSPRPDLVLLDINMPRMDGITALKTIRQDERFKHLPVMMLTTSKSEEDKMKTFNLNINAYIVKPVGFENFAEAVKNINIFWQMVEHPEFANSFA